ncbi:small kinetochore-associated protein [Grammomys surdaster]|uniref:small kinetochore-associated protein n=1 Tax=Grammomys surdaster TaxID=491861 RepID=UPI00109F5D99|nr:small kinetochore-associated protein [Grammomys surdaster]
MAAPKAEAQETVFRTTGPPTDSEPRPFPPSSRKFPFESAAADSTEDWAVAAEHLLKGSGEDSELEHLAPGVQPSHLATMASAKTVCDAQPHSMPSCALPADTQTRATSKLPVKSKEADMLRHYPGGSEPDVTKVTKPRRENGQVKAAEPASRRTIRNSYKPFNKQKPEEELKDKNELLEAVNKQLHQKLTETQGELKDLTQKVELLEKFQDNCLAILESKGLNPGQETLASKQEPSTDHADSMLLLETLKDELKVFNETARKQMEELQALKVKLKLKEEERIQFLEQQTLCKGEASDFTIVLEDMEQLLEM